MRIISAPIIVGLLLGVPLFAHAQAASSTTTTADTATQLAPLLEQVIALQSTLVGILNARIAELEQQVVQLGGSTSTPASTAANAGGGMSLTDALNTLYPSNTVNGAADTLMAALLPVTNAVTASTSSSTPNLASCSTPDGIVVQDGYSLVSAPSLGSAVSAYYTCIRGAWYAMGMTPMSLPPTAGTGYTVTQNP